MLKFFILPVVGFLIGIMIISLGGGGGAVYVGILTAFFNIPPAIATSTSLATIIPTTAMGAFSHWKAGNVNVRLGFIMLAGGIVGSVIGSLCSNLLPEGLYNKIIGVILLVFSFEMLLSYLRKKRAAGKEGEVPCHAINKPAVIKAVVFGLIGGIMSGLAGLSGGASVTAGLTILGCGALEVVGTSIFVLVGISILSFAIHLGIGSVDWELVGLLSIGTVTGAFLGPVFLKRMKKSKLEKVMQPVLIIIIAVIGVLQVLK